MFIDMDKEYSLIGTFLRLRDVEVCGHLFLQSDMLGIKNYFEHKDQLKLYVDNVGLPDEKGRGMCVKNFYSNYTWHTHPFNLLPYPSEQDIVEVITSNIKNSLVFTFIGIYDITCNIKKEKANELKYKKILDKIFYLVDKENKIYDTIALNLFLRQIEKVDTTIDLKITFTEWSSFQGKYYLK